MTIEYAHVLPRRGTAATWTTANPVLLMGEQGLETDTGKTKRGDGATAWAVLPYLIDTASASSTYGPLVDSNGDGLARLPGAHRNALTGWFHISGYPGADPTGVTSSQSAVAAAFADAAAYAGATMNSIVAAGATVYVDGQYLLTAPLIPPTKTSIIGNGREISRLFNNTSDLFAWTTGTGLAKVTFKDIALETGATGGHIFNVYGDSTAYLTQSLFLNCTLRSRNTASSLLKWREPASGANGAMFIGNVFDNCELDAQASRTVPAFDMLVTYGNVINSNVWKNSWCQGHSTTAAPFFRIECNSGGYCYHNSFRDLVGEQNGGGFIHLYANAGFVVQNCPDWDLVAAYTDSVYKFVQGTARTSFSTGLIENSYRLSNPGGLGSGIYDIVATGNTPTTTTTDKVRIKNCNPPGVILAANLNGSANVDGLTRAYKLVTTTYVIVDTDPDLIICNSASAFTVTLPAATAAKNGRTITVKNIGAGVITISATVDGAASPTLAQWAKASYLTDGGNAALGRIWFTV